MKRNTEIKDLGYLGREAQFKIAKALFEDAKMFNEIYPVIDPNYFSEAPLRTIIGLFMEYYKKKGLVPSYNAILLQLKQKQLTGLDIDEYKEYLDAIQNTDTTEIDTALELAITFCKQQKMIAVANKIIDSVRKGYSANQTLKFADELLNIENFVKDETILNPMNVIDDVLSEEREVRVPTGLVQLDDTLNGGLSKGSLACLQANAGCGKTTFSCIFASNAAARGYKVLQIFFEDRLYDICRKHYAVLAKDRSINNYVHPFNANYMSEEVKSNEGFESIKENLMLLKLPTGKKTVEDIEMSIRRCINTGFQPDMVIIDYFDCLKMSSNPIRNTWDAETSCMRKLENLAQSNNIALWVMQQGNRSGESEKGGSTVQGAYTKKQIASIYITVSRLNGAQERNRATMTIDKNRQGSLATFTDIYLNNGYMEIDMKDSVDSTLDLIFKEEK